MFDLCLCSEAKRSILHIGLYVEYRADYHSRSRVRCLVGEDANGQHGHNIGNVVDVAVTRFALLYLLLGICLSQIKYLQSSS